MSQKKLNICLGIDLGTTNSVASFFSDNKFRVLENNDGLRITPSFVFIDEKQGVEVGLAAKRRAKKSPKDVFSSFKRLIGLKFKDLKKLNLPYEVIEGKNGMCEVKDSRGKVYDVIFLSSLLLKSLKEDAEKALKGKVAHAVITVPAYFNNDQRNATKEAAKLAGLDVDRLIVEPSAAATVSSDIQIGKILVFDLGGGTFDVSIIDKQIQDDQTIYEVLGTEGDTQLGGRDFDKILFDLVDAQVIKLTGISLYKCPRALIEVQEAVEGAKKQLSSKQEADIAVSYLDSKVFGLNSEEEPYSIEMTISRAEFENLTSDLINSSMNIVDKSLNELKLKVDDIKEVILVGGMTRMPLIREKLIAKFGDKKINVKYNPDEVVSMGAAQQGAFIYGYSENAPLVLNNLPLSLGIETLGGVFTKLLEKNRSIPCEAEEVFSTAEDNQTRVTISVFQGERGMARDNHNLGSFDLVGIDAQPRGLAKIKVKFDVDENGILIVSATDEKSQKTQNLELNFNLEQSQIDKMTKEAEEFREEDEKRKNFVQKKTTLLQLVFTIEKELDSKFEEEEVYKKLLEVISKSKAFTQEEDYSKESEIDSLTDEVRKLSDEFIKLKHQNLNNQNTQSEESKENISGEEAEDKSEEN